MENENENAQVDVVEQEEQTSDDTSLEEETQEEEVITIPKKDFTRMERKARAYEATKQTKPIINNQSIPKPSDILKAEEFKLYRMGYSETEIDLIMHNGGMKILEDKNNPIVVGLSATREQRKAEDLASQTSGSSSQLSEVERKYTAEQLANMTSAELEKILPRNS